MAEFGSPEWAAANKARLAELEVGAAERQARIRLVTLRELGTDSIGDLFPSHVDYGLRADANIPRTHKFSCDVTLYPGRNCNCGLPQRKDT